MARVSNKNCLDYGRGNRILRETCEEKTSLAHLSCQIEAPQQFSQEGAHIVS